MARKKISIEPIPFLLFLIVTVGLVFSLYYGVFSDFQSRNIEKGSAKFFLALDNISLDNKLENFDTENIKRIYYSIDREPGIDGKLSKYGYCNLLEDYLKTISIESDSVRLVRKNAINRIIQIEEDKKDGDFKSDNPYFDELQKSIKKKDYNEAISYLKNLEGQYMKQKEEIGILKRRNNWLVPIAFCASFFVLFYGINQAIKIK